MNRPTQTVHIIVGGTTYTFDSVIKAEHTHTMEMLEDAEELSNYTHVNYAVRKPSTIALEVSVSDTVNITNEPLTKGASTRSASAYATLLRLQRARGITTVVTRRNTFTNMVMSDFVVSEDPDHQNEMYANVGFSEAYLVEKIAESSGGGGGSGGNGRNNGDKPPADNTNNDSILLGLRGGKQIVPAISNKQAIKSGKITPKQLFGSRVSEM